MESALRALSPCQRLQHLLGKKIELNTRERLKGSNLDTYSALNISVLVTATSYKITVIQMSMATTFLQNDALIYT